VNNTRSLPRACPHFNITSMIYHGTIWHKYNYMELSFDKTPWAWRDVILPYTSLAANVCEIRSRVFPNLGSMTHSKFSGWLCGIQKRKGEKAENSRGTNILRDKGRGELGIAYYSITGDLERGCDWRYCKPYVHITIHLAGTKTCTYRGLHVWLKKLGTRTDDRSQIRSLLDQVACRRWSVPDERIQARRIFQGS